MKGLIEGEYFRGYPEGNDVVVVGGLDEGNIGGAVEDFDALQRVQGVMQVFFAGFVDGGQGDCEEGWFGFVDFDEGSGVSYFEGDVLVFVDCWGEAGELQGVAVVLMTARQVLFMVDDGFAHDGVSFWLLCWFCGAPGSWIRARQSAKKLTDQNRLLHHQAGAHNMPPGCIEETRKQTE